MGLRWADWKWVALWAEQRVERWDCWKAVMLVVVMVVWMAVHWVVMMVVEKAARWAAYWVVRRVDRKVDYWAEQLDSWAVKRADMWELQLVGPMVALMADSTVVKMVVQLVVSLAVWWVV